MPDVHEWGGNRETKWADVIDLPEGIDKVAILTDGDDCRNAGDSLWICGNEPMPTGNDIHGNVPG